MATTNTNKVSLEEELASDLYRIHRFAQNPLIMSIIRKWKSQLDDGTLKLRKVKPKKK